MKNKYILTVVLIAVSMIWVLPGLLDARDGADGKAVTDKELMEKAKLELFDRKWDAALNTLEQMIARFPDSPHYPQALFYKGKCLVEQKKVKQALEAYNRYIEISQNESLREEAYIAAADLNFELFKNGEKRYAKQVIALLKNENTNVSYFAALKLSHANDKKVAEEAVPILKKIVLEESDDELVDRAKVALMRIDPGYLKDVSKKKGPETRMFNLRVIDKKTKKVKFALSLPFVLAKLAMDALPKEGKEALEEEDVDIDKILNALIKVPKLMRFEEEDVIVEIWLE